MRLQRYHHSPSLLSALIILSKELAKKEGGLKGDHYLELLELCIRWHAVPVSYELGVVVKQGDHAQRISWVTEIWKGMHDGEVVALKVLRLSQDNPAMKVAQQVSVLYNPRVGGSFLVILTNGVAVLRGSTFDEADRT